MNVIVNGAGGQHDLDVSSSFIQGYESVGGTWTGSIEMRTDSLSSSLAYARDNNFTMVMRSTTGMEGYLSVASSSYPDVLTVMPAGSNSYVLVYSGIIPQVILITGAGDVNNETGYHIEFFAPDPIQIEPDASSYSNGYIAGQIAYIMDSVPTTSSWEARYRAQQTATPGTSGSSFDGYGLIDINSAIAYSGSIAEDPFISTGSQTGSDVPLGGFTMRYLTPVTISSSLNLYGNLIQTGSINTKGQITAKDSLQGSIYISATNTDTGSYSLAGYVISNGNGTNDFSIIKGNSTYQFIPLIRENVVFSMQTGSMIFANAADLLSNTKYLMKIDIENDIIEMTGSLNVSGTSNFDGAITASNMLVTDTIIADTFIVNTFQSSSTDVVSGSTKFGSLQTDTHQFTGSIYISGSMFLSHGSNVVMSASTNQDWPYIELTNYVNSLSQISPSIRFQRVNYSGVVSNQTELGKIIFNQPFHLVPEVFWTTAKIASTVVSESAGYGSDLRFYTSFGSTTPSATTRMLIDAYSGSVGIGNFGLGAVPSALLDVRGTTKFGSNAAHTHQITGSTYALGKLSIDAEPAQTAHMTLTPWPYSYGEVYIALNSGGGGTLVSAPQQGGEEAPYHLFYNDGTQSSVLDAWKNSITVSTGFSDIFFTAGNVGIGTTYPSTTLTVSGNITLTGSLYSDIHQSAPSYQEGALFWDSGSHTYAIYNDVSDVTLQVGQETHIRVYAGEYIPNGSPVYISGSVLNNPKVFLALADGTRTYKYQVIGIATHDIAQDTKGFITINGRVNDVDMSGFTAGQGLFLSNINSGSYIGYPPAQPYERVLCGYCITGSSNGKMLVDIVALPEATNVSVGIVDAPEFTDEGGGVFTVGTGSVNLNTLATGKGTTKNYQLTASQFTLTSSFLDVHYICACYNSGSPIYRLLSDKSEIDEIQSTLVSTITYGAGSVLSYASWDNPGILLSNKLSERITNTHGIQRQDGLILGESGSKYVTVTSGSVYQGINRFDLPYVNSGTGSRLIQIVNSGSWYSGSSITQFNNTQYDDGTGLQTLGNNQIVTNWVYRGIGSQNSTVIMLSDEYAKIADAIAGQPPTPPTELGDIAILLGRAIFQQGVDTALQIDTAFTQVFVPAGITLHNNLDGLQGGTTNEYYHLTSNEYTGTGTGVIVRQLNSNLSGSVKITGSLIITGSLNVSDNVAIGSIVIGDFSSSGEHFEIKDDIGNKSFAISSTVGLGTTTALYNIGNVDNAYDKTFTEFYLDDVFLRLEGSLSNVSLLPIMNYNSSIDGANLVLQAATGYVNVGGASDGGNVIIRGGSGNQQLDVEPNFGGDVIIAGGYYSNSGSYGDVIIGKDDSVGILSNVMIRTTVSSADVSVSGSTNIFGDTKITGSLIITGSQTTKGITTWTGSNSGVPYGNMYAYQQSIDIPIASSGVWYEVNTGLTGSMMNQCEFSSSKILVYKTGIYEVQFTIAVSTPSPPASDEIMGAVFLNGNAVTSSAGQNTLASLSGRYSQISGQSLINIPVSGAIGVGVQNETSTNNLNMEHLTLTLKMVGGN